MKKIICSLIFCLALTAPLSTAFAGVPERVSYQGTLRKSGVIHTGTVPMQFRITSGDGSAVYWTSGSTDVYVSAGLFRYPLGTPNEAQFLSADWANIVPYVEVTIEGTTLPREPLYSTPYSLYSKYSGGARGDLRVYDGDIIISTTSGSKGLRFQDGTLQTTAALFPWTVNGGNIYATPAGGVGIGAASPAARLDVKAAGSAATDMAQIWRNSAGTVVSSVSATGVIKAARFIGDGSGLTGVVSGISGVTADSSQFSGDGSAGNALTLRLSSVTLQGNVFNGAGQLVRLDGAGLLPAADGSALTGLTKDQVGLGSVTNVAQIPGLIGTAKGDIITFTGSAAPARLPVGNDGEIIASDSSQASGLRWIAPPSAPVSSVFGRTGAVTGAASDVGLGNVTNDAQLAKSLGTLKGDLITFTASAAPARLPVGNDGEIIASDSSQASGLRWIALPSAPVSSVFGRTGAVTGAASDVGLGNVTNDAQLAKSLGTLKGDLITFTASAAPARLPVGNDGEIIASDSSQASGLRWIALPSAPVSSVFGRTGAVTGAASDVGLGNVTNDAQLKSENLDADPALAANSDSKLPSQRAVKTYVDGAVATREAAVTGGLGTQYYRGDKAWAALNAAAVGGGTFPDEAYSFQNAVNFPGSGKWDASGNLGIGTASPRSPLDVNGTITGKPAVLNATSVVDFATGNLQYTADSCGAFSLWNMKDGGSYTFVIKGTSASTCSFSAYLDSGATALSVHMPPDNTATTEGQQTLYSMVVLGGDVYLAWVAGY